MSQYGATVTNVVQQVLTTMNQQRPADPVERVKSIAADIAALRAAELGLQSKVAEALVAADRAGRAEDGTVPRGHRENLVRAAEGGVARAKVFQLLGEADLQSAARAALRPVWQNSQGDWSLANIGQGRVALRAHGDYIAVFNETPALIAALREAGLHVKCDGPGRTMAEDLANHLDAEVTFA
ncbi:hypothetical protein ACW14Y_41240 [Kitasatospora sp. cg17-2]